MSRTGSPSRGGRPTQRGTRNARHRHGGARWPQHRMAGGTRHGEASGGALAAGAGAYGGHREHRHGRRAGGEVLRDIYRGRLARWEDAERVCRGGMTARGGVITGRGDAEGGVRHPVRGEHHRGDRVERIARRGAADLLAGRAADE